MKILPCSSGEGEALVAHVPCEAQLSAARGQAAQEWGSGGKGPWAGSLDQSLSPWSDSESLYYLQ